jgi:hypothetical protein
MDEKIYFILSLLKDNPLHLYDLQKQLAQSAYFENETNATKWMEELLLKNWIEGDGDLDNPYYLSSIAKIELNKHEADKAKDVYEKNLELRKKEIDYHNAERVYKTYFTTRFITWISFIIAVLLGLLKVAESLKLWPYHK